MLKRIEELAAVLLLLLAIANCSEKPTSPKTGDLLVFVLGVKSNPVSGAIVKLSWYPQEPPHPPSSISDTTGIDGKAEFLAIEARQYSMYVHAAGFHSYNTDIEIVQDQIAGHIAVLTPTEDYWSWGASSPFGGGFIHASGIIDGYLYVLCNVYDMKFQRYDPNSDSWALKEHLPTERYNAASGVIDGKLYVAGGRKQDPLDILEVYDPVEDTWHARTPMPTARDIAAAGVIDGKLYVVGGFAQNPTNILEVYNPITDTWTSEKPMPTPRQWPTVAVFNDELYVIGGSNDPGFALDVVEVYNPQTDSWTSKAPIPISIYSAGIGVIDGKLYIAAGGELGFGSRFLQVYDPVNNSWEQKAKLSIGRQFVASGVINEKLYIFGGVEDLTWIPTPTTQTLEIYTP